jgi:phosphoribosylanthranilate isomerase
MYRIKICGITSADDALLAAEAGADAIGVNLYEQSPRFVRPDDAAQIVDRLREAYTALQIQVFGVFVNATLDDIIWTIREANLYGPDRGFGIQLHGDEPPELIRDLHEQGLGLTDQLLQVTGHAPTVPIVRAFRCRGADLAAEEQYLKQCEQLNAIPQGVLLDAYAPDAFGGTGQCVDWTTIAHDRHRLSGLPLVLAGGLNPENVGAAMAAAKPDAVDVASGVESTPRKKDAAKVYAFVAAARAAFAKH